MMITNFASGELSRKLSGRTDLQQYYQGAARISNFDVIPTGGITRRTGFKRLIEIDGNSRIIPFILDKNRSFIFEIIPKPDIDTPGTLNVYKTTNDGLTLTQSIETEYASRAEIEEIQYAQNYDTLILVHRNYQPLEIKWNNTEFIAAKMVFDFVPDVVLDDDFDYVMIVSEGWPVLQATSDNHLQFTYTTKKGDETITKTKDYPLDATAYCIKDGHLYIYDSAYGWIVEGNDQGYNDDQFTAEAKRPGCVAFFNSRLFFASSFEKVQKIWASAAPDTDNVRYNKFATYKKYVTVNRSVKDADLHTFTCDVLPQQDNTTILTNVTQDFTAGGVLQKNPTFYYVSGENIPVGAKVLSITTTTITIDRKIDTAFTNQVCTIQLWRNADTVSADDYEYQVLNNNVTTEDCSVNFELASDANDSIVFMSSNKFLSVGTESSIWSIASGLTALNVMAEMQGRYGADNIQGQAVGTATVYFAQGKRGIREFYYSSESEAFQTNNIAILSEQMLFESPAVDFDYITNPYNKIVITRADGTITQLLYDKTNGVMAWTRIEHGKGKIKNVAVTRGNLQNDLLFAVVEYSVGAHTLYYIERYDDNDGVYLDGWKVYDEDLEGYTEDAILYNATQDTLCCIDNIPLNFKEMTDLVYIGYKFVSDIISMPVINQDPTGKKRIVSLLVRFLDSYLPVIKIPNRPDEHFNDVTPPYSGLKKITFPGISERDVDFEIFDDGVKPVNILCINAQTD